MLVLDDLSKHAALTGAGERIRDRHTSLSVQISMVRQHGIRQEIADLWAGRRAMQH